MEPYLHQGNIYTKRKLQVWRDQKCIPLVGAITPLSCTYRQNTWSRGRHDRAQNGKLGKCNRPIAMVPCAHQGNIYTKRKLRVLRDQKYFSLVGAITPLTYPGRQNTPSRGRHYRAQNGNLGKFGQAHGHGTVFELRKYL